MNKNLNTKTKINKKIKKPPIVELRKLESKIKEIIPDLGKDDFLLYPETWYSYFSDKDKDPEYGFYIRICSGETNFKLLCDNFEKICKIIMEVLPTLYPNINFYYKDVNIKDGNKIVEDHNAYRIELNEPEVVYIHGEIFGRYGKFFVKSKEPKKLKNPILNEEEIKKLFYDFYEAVKVDQTCNHKRASDLFIKRISKEYKIIKK